jgi:hypothetical protein
VFCEPAIVPPVTVVQKINSDSILSVEVACEQSRNGCEAQGDDSFLSNSSSQRLATPRDKYFRGRYSLSYMPLGVIGDVHEETGYGAGQILPADSARMVQSVGLFAQLQDPGRALG